MTTSRKKRKHLLRYARRGMNLPAVNLRLAEEGMDPIHEQLWLLWTNYYVDIVKHDPYFEHELIDNNRSLAWFAQEINRRKHKVIIS